MSLLPIQNMEFNACLEILLGLGEKASTILVVKEMIGAIVAV
jgi:hypothetical protein